MWHASSQASQHSGGSLCVTLESIYTRTFNILINIWSMAMNEMWSVIEFFFRKTRHRYPHDKFGVTVPL